MREFEYAQGFWNPYVAGVALGLVLLVTFYVMGTGLGASGAFAPDAPILLIPPLVRDRPRRVGSGPVAGCDGAGHRARPAGIENPGQRMEEPRDERVDHGDV